MPSAKPFRLKGLRAPPARCLTVDQHHVNGGAQALNLLDLQDCALQGGMSSGWGVRSGCGGGQLVGHTREADLPRRLGPAGLGAGRPSASATRQAAEPWPWLRVGPSPGAASVEGRHSRHSPQGSAWCCTGRCLHRTSRLFTNMRRSTMSDCVSLTTSCSRSGIPAEEGPGPGHARWAMWACQERC